MLRGHHYRLYLLGRMTYGDALIAQIKDEFKNKELMFNRVCKMIFWVSIVVGLTLALRS